MTPSTPTVRPGRSGTERFRTAPIAERAAAFDRLPVACPGRAG